MIFNFQSIKKNWTGKYFFVWSFIYSLIAKLFLQNSVTCKNARTVLAKCPVSQCTGQSGDWLEYVATLLLWLQIYIRGPAVRYIWCFYCLFVSATVVYAITAAADTNGSDESEEGILSRSTAERTSNNGMSVNGTGLSSVCLSLLTLCCGVVDNQLPLSLTFDH